MTLKQFFKLARKTTWGVNSGGFVRRGGHTHARCPLAYVTGTWFPSVAARRGALPLKYAVRIAQAADGNTIYRSWLLKRLGIGE